MASSDRSVQTDSERGALDEDAAEQLRQAANVLAQMPRWMADAITGVEAVSNGIPAFKPPEWKHAQIVLVLMGTFFGTIFLGMSFLSGQLGIVPDPTEAETVVSQLTWTLVGGGTAYHYLVQISTSLLLVLAANTAFADFPRLGSTLARDRFAPNYFQFRGDRLAFTTGIVALAAL
jgi:amino acid transporter